MSFEVFGNVIKCCFRVFESCDTESSLTLCTDMSFLATTVHVKVKPQGNTFKNYQILTLTMVGIPP